MVQAKPFAYFCRNGEKVRRYYIGTTNSAATRVIARRHRLVQAEIRAAREAREGEQRTHEQIEADIEFFIKQREQLLKLWLQLQA